MCITTDFLHMQTPSHRPHEISFVGEKRQRTSFPQTTVLEAYTLFDSTVSYVHDNVLFPFLSFFRTVLNWSPKTCDNEFTQCRLKIFFLIAQNILRANDTVWERALFFVTCFITMCRARGKCRAAGVANSFQLILKIKSSPVT